MVLFQQDNQIWSYSGSQTASRAKFLTERRLSVTRSIEASENISVPETPKTPMTLKLSKSVLELATRHSTGASRFSIFLAMFFAMVLKNKRWLLSR